MYGRLAHSFTAVFCFGVPPPASLPPTTEQNIMRLPQHHCSSCMPTHLLPPLGAHRVAPRAQVALSRLQPAQQGAAQAAGGSKLDHMQSSDIAVQLAHTCATCVTLPQILHRKTSLHT
jgi:hypothetical protein